MVFPKKCRASDDCQGFVINYDSDECFRVDTNSDDYESRDDLVPADGKVNFFRKVCLRAPPCEKAWLFERVPNYEVAGYDDRVTEDVRTREECEEACLRAESLPCRSAEYDYGRRECRMSTETRRTQPSAYRATNDDVDYLENQCAPGKEAENNCDFVEYEGRELGYEDLQLAAATEAECRRRCEGLNAFVCRSFTFVQSSNTCLISGDDNISAGPNALTVREGARYFQKAPCVDPADPAPLTTTILPESNSTATTTTMRPVQRSRQPKQFDYDENFVDQKVSLVCTDTEMTVTLNTEDEFRGKLFAASNPRGCSARGSGATTTSLTFSYEEEESECGVRLEEKGVFSNVVVVQHHPIIQQKGDRAIKLFCFFEVAGDKVVTNSYDVIAETVEPRPGDPDGDGRPGGPEGRDPDSSLPGIPTSVVNGTAPQPRVLLRIVNEAGEDIQGTKLGEPLFLRIELDGESIFDIFARNLVAQSGLDDEEIKLLDDRGCPTDPVFPGLQKDPETGDLLGRFEAFKFSDTTVVNFQVNVQFCQDECNPVDCGDGVLSYGKKRRKRRSAQIKEEGDLPETEFIYDSNLRQDVIYYTTPLRKQIRVEPGTKVDEVRDGGDGRDSRGRAVGAGQGVFVEGDYDADDVFCASWTVVMVTAASFVFLQFCILVVCVLCIYAGRNRSTHHYSDKAAAADYPSSSSSSASSSGSSSHSSPFVGNNSLYPRPAHPGSVAITAGPSSTTGFIRSHPSHFENSASTLRSLRTSLRD